MNITCHSEKIPEVRPRIQHVTIIYHPNFRINQSELQHYLCFSDKVLNSRVFFIRKRPLSLIMSINKYRVNMHFSVSMGCFTVRGTDKTEPVTITLGFFPSSWGRYHTGMLGPYGLQQSSNDIKGDWRLDLHWAVWRPVREDSSWKWKLHGILRKKSCVTALIITM